MKRIARLFVRALIWGFASSLGRAIERRML